MPIEPPHSTTILLDLRYIQNAGCRHAFLTSNLFLLSPAVSAAADLDFFATASVLTVAAPVSASAISTSAMLTLVGSCGVEDERQGCGEMDVVVEEHGRSF
jgi:hypothetical protein